MVVLVFLFVLAFPMFALSDDAVSNYALLIGVEHETKTESPSVDDRIESFRRFLMENGFAENDIISLQSNSEESRRSSLRSNILIQLRRLKNKGENANIVIAFLGSGFADGENSYLRPTDGDPEKPGETMIPAEIWWTELEKIHSRLLLLLDGPDLPLPPSHRLTETTTLIRRRAANGPSLLDAVRQAGNGSADLNGDQTIELREFVRFFTAGPARSPFLTLTKTPGSAVVLFEKTKTPQETAKPKKTEPEVVRSVPEPVVEAKPESKPSPVPPVPSSSASMDLPPEPSKEQLLLPLPRTLLPKRSDASIHSVSFGVEGKHVAAAVGSRKAVHLDAVSGNVLHEIAVSKDDELLSLSLHPTDSYLLTGFASRRVVRWTVKDFAVAVGEYEGLPQAEGALSVAFSRDGKYLLAASAEAAAVWRLLGSDPPRVVRGESPVENTAYALAAMDNSGSRLLTAFFDQPIILWDVASGEVLQRFEGHKQVVAAVAISGDGTRLASGSYDKTVVLWDAGSGKTLRRLEGHQDGVRTLSFSPDDRFLLSGSHDETAILWNVETGEEVRRFSGFGSSVLALAFSPGGRMVLFGLHNGKLILDRTGL